MRLRNLKNKNDLIRDCMYLVYEPEKFKGSWNKVFKNDIAYLANTYDYDINFYDKVFGSEITIKEKELDVYVKDTCKKSSFIYDKRSELLEEIKSQEMESLYLDIELPLVYVLANMEETGFKILKKTYDLHNEPIFENNIVTEHEKMFSDEGIKIKALIAKL